MRVVGYAFSPVDLIPDPIPVIGYLDDLILLPFGVRLAVKMIPTPLMEECRARAHEVMRNGAPTSWLAGAIVIAIWLLLTLFAVVLAVRALE